MVNMSSFNCPECGTAIIDSPKGYITSCEHHKAENVNVLRSKYFEVNEQGNVNGKD